MTAASSSATANIPTVRGKYRPIFELGRGGMADVVLAVLQGPGGFNKLQVLKRLRPELAADPEFLTMFLDEARLSARINHPNVVQTNEVGHDGKFYFIAMEYLEGQSLESFLRRGGTRGGVPMPVLLRIVIDALGGLHYAHELAGFDGTALKVVHRDISPQNIFVTYEGTTKVLDFGIAKAADSSAETRAGVVKGKVAYMAPEQLRGGKEIDRRADIFSMGAVLWRVITGKRLWKGLSDIEIFQNLARGEIPSPTTVAPDADPKLVEICMKALAVNPKDRYGTAAEFQAELEVYLDALPQRASASPREIGKLLVELFADHRAEVKGAVEARLRAAVSTNGTGEVPALPGEEQPSQASLSTSQSSASLPKLEATVPAQTTQDAMAATQGVTRAEGARPAGNRALLMGLAAGAGVGLVGFLVIVTVAAKTHPVAPITSPSTVLPNGAPTDVVELRVRVTPPGAKLFVDDDPIREQPQYIRDGAMHWVHAEAQGYTSKAVLVPFDVPTQTVELTLEKDRAKPDDPKAPHTH